ncbi:hypothetical protein DCC85_10175 [Paenibacillus sp. CAA11]|uniref:serine hydrolase n=1 Tax=Paenibacillus sp. CAA11 TaxID=1532905 RepID=UPI000D38CB09|nr:serine hydrolase [Paenibacillus sp. CAA11]AWB44556.1 hypothetical protein DCC85_10175 [Paenibacillus sp. CAA11]
MKTNVKDLMSLMMAEMKPYKAGMVLQNMLLIKERQKPVLDENGLGVFVRKLPDQRRLIYHSGDNRGFHSFYGYIPESGDGLVILTNSDNGIDLRQDIYSAWIKFQTGEDAPGYLALKQKREINRYLAAVLYLLLGCYIAVAVIRLIRGRRGFISKHAQKVKWIFALKAVLIGGVGISLIYYTYFLSNLNLAAGLKQVVMAVFLWLIGLLLVAIFPKYRKRKQSI